MLGTVRDELPVWVTGSVTTEHNNRTWVGFLRENTSKRNKNRQQKVPGDVSTEVAEHSTEG